MTSTPLTSLVVNLSMLRISPGRIVKDTDHSDVPATPPGARPTRCENDQADPSGWILAILSPRSKVIDQILTADRQISMGVNRGGVDHSTGDCPESPINCRG